MHADLMIQELGSSSPQFGLNELLLNVSYRIVYFHAHAVIKVESDKKQVNINPTMHASYTVPCRSIAISYIKRGRNILIL